MKRFIIFTLIATLLIGVFPPAVSAKATYVTVKQVALKQSASTKAKTLVTIPKGKVVTHLSDKGSWSNVQYGKQKGYVAKRDIKKQTAAPKPAAGTLPAPSYAYTQFASYKGGSVISIYGKSYKIDPPLLPFFKKNVATLQTIFGLPIISGNTVTGYKELKFDLRGPKAAQIQIDATAASRIHTFVVPIDAFPNLPVTITAAAPVRQLATYGARPYEKGFYGESDLRLNGTFRQVDLTGRATLTGKATIDRLVLRMGDLYPSAHSYTADVQINGTITHLESLYRDAQVTLGKTTVVRNLKGVDANQLLDGQFGLIRGTRPQATLVRGRWMNDPERRISSWTEMMANRTIDDKTLRQWFTQLGLKHVTDDALPSYRLAFETNAKATNTRIEMGTLESWQRLILDVNASLGTTTYDHPFVLANDNDILVRHDRPLRDLKTDRTDLYQYELIGLIGPTGQFEQIAFKRTHSNPKLHQFGTLDSQMILEPYEAPGLYRHVSIQNGKRHIVSVEVADVDGRLGIVKVNGQPLHAFQKPAPKVEVKLSSGYIFIRSSDQAWLQHAQQFKTGGTYDEPTQLAVGNVSDAGDWNKGTYLAAGSYGLSKGKSIRIQAYGYKDVLVRIP
ncbi:MULTISPECIES: hypothetical protein [unclassified Exiguobacterium]|uniref:SH3 domain-containing protein n=1 Tax=unclassified Exiguobacterium TaxID=2644629 RepID=UPI00103A8058|nr:MULTISPECIES: hypothetical protein [unclassified Exiguobacterium]TCI39149.1 hypothetical protein EVJ29_00480 [Exiguobacterium sp. SH4S7]TCI63061.1 hypothetical protein EVJ21_05980 [Exiguobacterium sp. SH0S2]